MIDDLGMTQVRDIIDLYEARIAELNKKLSHAETQSDKALAIRDLEQQAKGVESLRFPTMLRKMWAGGEIQEWLSDCAEGLREQAKALQEQDK